MDLPHHDPARVEGPGQPHEQLASGGRIAVGATFEVPAREGRAVRLPRGATLAVGNPFGTQVGDLWAFVDWDPHEALSMEHARTGLRRLSPRAGDALVTNRRRAILTLVEDSSPGVHDTLVAACDVHRYRTLGHEAPHDNCTDNLRLALAALGLRPTEVPAPLNLWMNIPVGEGGAMDWRPTVARPGDRVVLRAEMDAVVVVSSCPMDLLPINGEAAVIRPLTLERLS